MSNEFLRMRFGRILILGAVFQDILFGVRGMRLPGLRLNARQEAAGMPSFPDSTIVEFGFYPLLITIYFDHKTFTD